MSGMDHHCLKYSLPVKPIDKANKEIKLLKQLVKELREEIKELNNDIRPLQIDLENRILIENKKDKEYDVIEKSWWWG
tara:strand:+ start:162 stop:395 length:234 start_codon:yes stop_codon:yes gene_type:complete